MNIKNILLLPLLVLLLVGCHRKEDIVPEDPNPHVPYDCGQTEFNDIDNSLMQQFLFKSGTYWVYKDSVDNSTDSCFCYGAVIRKGSYMIGGGMGIPPCVRNYRYAIDSISLPDSFQYYYYIQDKYLRVVSPFGFAAVSLCSTSSGNLTGDNLSVFYPSIIINAATYSNVYKLHFQTQYGKFRSGYFYMKPGVGIIKTELYTTDFPAIRRVYELERYHIE